MKYRAMIRVTIELLSARTGRRTTLGVMDISNDGSLSDGSGDSPRGCYNARMYRRGSWSTVQRTGRVEDWPRRSKTVWQLLHKMLDNIYNGEKR